jgi:hypothetical protein
MAPITRWLTFVMHNVEDLFMSNFWDATTSEGRRNAQPTEIYSQVMCLKGEIKVVQTRLSVADHPRCNFELDSQ